MTRLSRYGIFAFECCKGILLGALLSYAALRLLVQDPETLVFRYAGY
jgi:hypothetical protein